MDCDGFPIASHVDIGGVFMDAHLLAGRGSDRLDPHSSPIGYSLVPYWSHSTPLLLFLLSF